MKRHRLLLALIVPVPVFVLVLFRPTPATDTAQSPQIIATEQTAMTITEPAPAEEAVTKRIVGYSENGRAIDAYQFGSGSSCLLFFAGIHGNEKGAVDMLRTFADEITLRPNIVSPEKKVVIIPMLNPDGYTEDLYRTNVNGVNLNRNFATPDWTTNPDEETFAGTEPFSEAEARALREVVQECVPSMVIAFHSQGGVISPEASAESVALANWYASKSGYTIYNDWNYPGTATQWFTSTTGKPAITVEISSHDKSDWELNKQPLLDLVSTNI
jgi:predicted deacylase